jgi:hypothetical protein
MNGLYTSLHLKEGSEIVEKDVTNLRQFFINYIPCGTGKQVMSTQGTGFNTTNSKKYFLF